MDERRRQLARARLYLIVDAAALGAVEPALAAGVEIVQLRDKSLGDDELAALGRTLRSVCDRHNALLIVNDRPPVALACGADGIHVGQDDEAVESVRRLLGPDLLVGVSTHTPAQITTAETSSADYLGVGPIYATPTKPGHAPVGLELVRTAVATTSKPFFAIGGIDASRAADVVAAGATRVAVVRAIADADDPAVAARLLHDQLDGALSAAGVE